MMMTDPLHVALRVIGVFEQLKIPYLIGGSLASSAHGIPRSTQDIDLVADMGEDHVGPFVESLQGEFYVDELLIRRAIRRKSSFNLIHSETSFKVDVFIFKDSPFARSEMARRRAERLSPETAQELYLASPEDIVLEKLAWYKLGGGASDRQWDDLLGILKVQAGRLDTGYIEHWAGALGLSDLWRQLLKDRQGSEGEGSPA